MPENHVIPWNFVCYVNIEQAALQMKCCENIQKISLGDAGYKFYH